MELTREQRELRSCVADLLRQHQAAAVPGQPGPDGPAGFDTALWRRLCGEIGIAGLAIPERYGGAGAGPVEVAIVAEQLGRTLARVPFLGSAVLAAQTLLACAAEGDAKRLLPPVADGTAGATLAWAGKPGKWDPCEAAFHAVPRPGGHWTLTGEASYVLDGASADVVVVAANAPVAIGLFEVDPRRPGVTRCAATAMDQTRPLATVRLAATGRSLCAQASPGLARARDLACVALAAEQAGVAARALELTVEHTKTRVQFGRAIATFQALAHRMADMYALVESARSLAFAAAAAAAAGAADLPLRAATAKVYCSQSLSQVTAEMIQLHGAIGITWEHDAHRFFKRAHGSSQLFGAPSAHLRTISDSIVPG